MSDDGDNADGDDADEVAVAQGQTRPRGKSPAPSSPVATARALASRFLRFATDSTLLATVGVITVVVLAERAEGQRRTDERSGSEGKSAVCTVRCGVERGRL